MRSLFIQSLTLASLAVAGCSQMKVNSEFDPEASFDGLTTYAWVERAADQERRSRVAPIAVRQIETSVDRELAAKGYQKVESEPDFLIGFITASDDRMGSAMVITDPRLGWVSGRTEVYVEREGALVLLVSDAAEDRIVWRGWATDVIQDPEPEQIVKKIDEAVTKILARFPPQER
jgi:hypothetical protein